MEDAENTDSLEKQLSDAENLLNETTQEVKSTATETTAAAETTETTPALTQEAAPEKTDEEEELVPHGEKSRLGRKVKRLEDTLTEIRSSLDFLKERTATPQVQSQEEEEELDLPENPTAEEVKEYIQKREEKLVSRIEKRGSEKTDQQQDKINRYKKEYTKKMTALADSDDDAELEIYKLMSDEKDLTFNLAHSNFEDAKEDFIINFRAATKAVLNKSKPGTRTTVANKPSQIPTGVNVPGNAQAATKIVDVSKWSKDEQDLAKMFSADDLAQLGI